MDENDNGQRRIVVNSNKKTQLHAACFDRDILIVVSKLKKYVKDKHGLNTSGDVAQRLSEIVRVSVDRAVDNTMQEGRKTLMAKDF